MERRRIFMAWPTMTQEMKDEASRVLSEEKLVLGESVYKFEEEFAEYIGVKHAISCSSGTDALFLILKSMNLEGEVITSPMSFVATANSIVSAQAKPIFADIKLETGNLNPSLITKSISNKSKAIMPVHLHGFPAEMNEIMEIAERNDLKVIEDACQSHGALYEDMKTGSIGDAGAFSFYSTKNMTVGGDGGMVTTNDDRIAEKIIKMRNGGREIGHKYKHDTLGYTHRLNSVNAAIGRLQLQHLDDWNERRNEIASMYINELTNIDGVRIPTPLSYSYPVYHLFPILISRRDEFVKEMKENGIEVGKNYPIAIPDQPFYKSKNPTGTWVNAAIWASKVACLPMHTDLSDDDVKYVIDKCKELLC